MQTGNLQPSYDSIAAAAAALGISKKDLRRAKKEGAPGFRGSRVYPAELVPWLKEKESQATLSLDGRALPDASNGVSAPAAMDKEGWEARRVRLQCERAEIELAEKRGELWESNKVRASWLVHMVTARLELDSMRTDLAPRIAGRSAEECERMLGEAIELVKAKLRGNPYGDGPCKCAACGERIPLILEDTVKPVLVVSAAKGNEAARGQKAPARRPSKHKKGRK